MATDDEARPTGRRVAMQFRVTVEDRERLRREAEVTGLTQTQFFELRMFGAARPIGITGRPRKLRRDPAQEVLPESA